MIVTFLLSRIAIDLLFGVLLLWFSSQYMLRRKDILLFAPFAGLGIVAAFTAGFAFYQFFSDSTWFFVEVTNLSLFIFLAAVLLYYDRCS